MSRPDGAYSLTRRRGKTGTVTRVTGSTANAETGARVDTTVTTTVRYLFRGPTNWSRLYRAEMTQQRVGGTTFVIWLPDVEAVFTELRADIDTITQDGKTYVVVDSAVEDNALVITAKDVA